MDIEARIISLAVKKLAGESSNEELVELHHLLNLNPGIKNSLKSIFTIWEMIDLDITISEKDIDDNITLISNRIQNQISGAKNTPWLSAIVRAR
jgi:hypothetical protein